MPKRTKPHAVTFNTLVIELDEHEGYELAIIGASLLETALEQSLKYTMPPMNARTTDRMFREGGPVGTLSAKIDTAYATKIIDQEAHSAMHSLREVRNEFAHAARRISIDDPPIRDMIRDHPYLRPKGHPQALDETVTFHGRVFDNEKLAMIQDLNHRVGFLVPWSPTGEFVDLTDKLRHQFWTCIMVAVFPGLGGWLSDATIEWDGEWPGSIA